MIPKSYRHLIAPAAVVLLGMCLAVQSLTAQNIEINGQKMEVTPKSPKRTTQGSKAKAPAKSSGGFGWGSNIGVARLSRAAQTALKTGKYAQATAYAEQATRSAPTDPNQWFLLGYAARLSGKTQESLDAYHHGLQLDPGSVDGLSGLAQTYVRAGNTDEAKRLLLQIVAANPKRENEVAMAGELFLQSGDNQRALSLLQRADSMRPGMRNEVLMATALMRMKQPQQAKQMLDRAKAHGGNSPEVARAFASYYRDSKDYRSAIQSLKAVSHKSPDLLAELAWTYELSGDIKDAADTYVQAANSAPKSIQYQLDAASTLVRAANIRKANIFLDRAAKLDANHYRLHAIRADIAKTEGRTQDAIREYTAALANLPEAAPEGPLYPLELRLSLANLYQTSGDRNGEKQQMDIAAAAISKIDIQGPARSEFLRLRAAIKSGEGDMAGSEADYKEAIALAPDNSDILLGYAAVLWRADKNKEAEQAFEKVLTLQPNNKFALMSLGYLARDDKNNAKAQQYFEQVAKLYPNEYEPYLALGDMYVSERKHEPAEVSYERAYQLAPKMALTVAGGANNGIEWHKLDLAGKWLARATGSMNDEPRVMRERERYLTFTGKYKESAAIGRKVIQLLPKDRDAAVYLGYDLYNLGRYDELLRLTSQYETVLPQEANIPLLNGYVDKQHGLLQQAADDFTRAMKRDPKMVEAYVNRGYVLNDLNDAQQAARDFNQAIKLSPNNGAAHLGLAFSNLELHHGRVALEEAEKAEKILGESGATHLAAAGAYREQQLYGKAVDEYRAALKDSPDDPTLHLALADVLFHQHRYNESVGEYKEALAMTPDDPQIEAQLADAYAHLRDRQNTYAYIRAAEQQGDNSAVLLETGNALLSLGDRDAAMQRFQRALDAPDANRVSVRLSLAELFVKEGHDEDARQQISVGFAEARVGEAAPVSTDQLTQAASLLLAMHDFDTSRRLYKAAQDSGADERVVAVGMANTFLAEGQTRNAEAELKSLGNPGDLEENYDYQLAMANVFRQQGNTTMALSALGRASAVTPEGDETLQRDVFDVAAQAGLPVSDKVSIVSNTSFAPIFEDETIYDLDAKLIGANNPQSLPTPRYSYESRSTAYYSARFTGWPLITGYVEERNARGQISYPSVNRIIDRDTYDTNFESAINPRIQIGSAKLQFSTGLQFTLRRDKESPLDLNQNLFRQFAYLTTNSLFNWLQISGDAIHEAGPFTLQNLSSKDQAAHLQFRVGRPWGNTALITGYGIRDLQIHPQIREYFSTNAYGGIEHKFGLKWKVTGLAELIRSWRVQDLNFGIGQAVRPSGQVEYRPNARWSFDGSFATSRGFGMHNYDNFETGFLVSYTRGWKGRQAALPDQTVSYPLRFSAGFRTQSFYDFGFGSTNTIVPVFQISLF